MVEQIRDCRKEKKKQNKEGGGNPEGWWDEEMSRMKNKVQKSWKTMKDASVEKWPDKRDQYRDLKREYKKLCKEKKGKWIETKKEKIKNFKDDNDMWRWLRKERSKGKKKKIDPNEDWKEYIMSKLGGKRLTVNIDQEEKEKVEGKGRKVKEIQVQVDKERENSVRIGEIDKAIAKLRKNKAKGSDGIENEVWIYSNRNMKEELREILNRIWNGDEVPDEWKIARIVPVQKGGDNSSKENYRGISILQSGYKIYATILARRLDDWLERNNKYGENQNGFRRNRGTTDNVIIMHKLIDRELRKKGGKMFAMYADLVAAFDKVKRENLWQKMEDMGVEDKLLEAIKSLYKVTIGRIETEKEGSEDFLIERGVRQGCPLSPMLFNLYISDVKDFIDERTRGDIKIGNTVTNVLGYADDIVLLAKHRNSLQILINHFGAYLMKKELTLNIKKTRIQIFRKGGGRRRKEEKWKWTNGEEIEISKNFKYLGYTFMSTNGNSEHIKYISKKANKSSRELWSIGERWLTTDLDMRLKLFERIIVPQMLVGAEVWGGETVESLERIQARYVKWVLGVAKQVPEYIWRTEVGMDTIKSEGIVRKWSFESKVYKKQEDRWIRKILEEEKEMEMKRNWSLRSKLEQELSRMGIDSNRLREQDLGGCRTRDEIKRRWADIDKQEREEKMKKSTFNPIYLEIKPKQGKGKYIKSWKGKRSDQILLAKSRTGCELNGNKIWEKDEKRMCRKCGEEKEEWDHMIVCGRDGKEQQRSWERKNLIRRMLKEDGMNMELLKNICIGRKE